MSALGKLPFWTTFVGFHLTFLVEHWLGAEGMPRRYAGYLPSDRFTTLNTVSIGRGEQQPLTKTASSEPRGQ